MAEVVLETQSLTMRFGGVVASDNVNFKLQARELRCLIGPNGAGKSTFFKCVTGLLTPSEGHVFMRGEEVTGWMPHQIAGLGVGIKTQTPNVMDALSVFENIWLSARRFHDPTESNRKTHEIIERLALGSIARTDLGQLAHGERQRVELGLVAVGDPWRTSGRDERPRRRSHDRNYTRTHTNRRRGDRRARHAIHSLHRRNGHGFSPRCCAYGRPH